jgi:hypothetical protein
MEDNNKKDDHKNLEYNRWIANQIIEIQQGYQNGLSSNKEIVEKISNDLLLKKEKIRNNILSFFITGITLIVGLSSFDPVKEAISYNELRRNNEWIIHNSSLTIVIIVVGFVLAASGVYIIMNYQIRNISKKLVNVEKEYYDGYTTQNFLKGFFNRYVLEPNKLNETQLRLLDAFFLIVQGSIVYKIFIKSMQELNAYNKPYEGFQLSDYSPKLFFLITGHAYNEYKKLFKNSQFFSFNSMPNSDLKEIFRYIDREELLETVWNGQIKEFIENYEKINNKNYEELKNIVQKLHEEKNKKSNIFSRFINYRLNIKR